MGAKELHPAGRAPDKTPAALLTPAVLQSHASRAANRPQNIPVPTSREPGRSRAGGR